MDVPLANIQKMGGGGLYGGSEMSTEREINFTITIGTPGYWNLTTALLLVKKDWLSYEANFNLSIMIKTS